jgi:hypothetical protein
MTDTTLELSRGDEYIVFYKGGPYDGQTDRRISTDGTWESSITLIAAFEGKETQLDYDFVEAKRLGDQVQVTYVWDSKASEPIEALDERGDA